MITRRTVQTSSPHFTVAVKLAITEDLVEEVQYDPSVDATKACANC